MKYFLFMARIAFLILSLIIMITCNVVIYYTVNGGKRTVNHNVNNLKKVVTTGYHNAIINNWKRGFKLPKIKTVSFLPQ